MANVSNTQASYRPEAGALPFISALFVLLGIGAFIFLFTLVTSDTDFQNAIDRPITYSASGLPAGLNISPTSGDITGVIGSDATGVYTVVVTATSTDPNTTPGQVAFTWTVGDPEDGEADPVSEPPPSPIEVEFPGNQFSDEGERVSVSIEAQDTSDVNIGAVLLAFLRNFGIIVPVLVFSVGVYSIRMGIKLFQRDIVTSMWARQLLLWLAIAGIFGILYGFVNAGNIAGGLIVSLLPWVFLEGLVLFILIWLMRNEHIFEGQETLTSRNTRNAWNLLIPTVIILLLVAARPLEQTFIASLTDQRFAAAREPQFVGFDNYTELLGLRIDHIPCEEASGGGCAVDEDGDRIFPRSRNYLIETVESYRDWGYRPMNEINLFGARWAISARDSDFISAVSNTLMFTVVSVSLELVFGLFIAMVVNSKFPGRGLMRTAMLVPWAIPTVISARLWEVMLRDGRPGVFNQVLLELGIIDQPISWLTSSDWQVLAMVAVDVWKTTPFMALILLAGLQVISRDVYEAADVDGASKVRQFFSITLPLLRPTIGVALVFRTLDAVRVFDVFQVLLGERAFSMATYNYNTLILGQEFGYASAVGVVIFVIILLFTVAYVRILGIGER
ncbi:MAG: ABC transporter permease subunit [Phototrophicaceae bacterium]